VTVIEVVCCVSCVVCCVLCVVCCVLCVACCVLCVVCCVLCVVCVCVCVVCVCVCVLCVLCVCVLCLTFSLFFENIGQGRNWKEAGALARSTLRFLLPDQMIKDASVYDARKGLSYNLDKGRWLLMPELTAVRMGLGWDMIGTLF